MVNPNADRDMLKEMRDILDQECLKSPKKRDYELISQLTDVLVNATSSADLADIETKNIEKIAEFSRNQTNKLKKYKWIRPAIPILVCIAVVFSLNAWSLHAWGMNLSEAVYHLTEGGISITPRELDPDIHLDISEDDPYGIRNECEKLGFSPLIPSYIPETMKLNGISKNEGDVNVLSLNYKEDEDIAYLGIRFTYIPDSELYNNTSYGFPSDDHKVHTETISGRTVVISWEDKVFHAVFCEDNIIYAVYGRKMDYDTVYKVLLSYFK